MKIVPVNDERYKHLNNAVTKSTEMVQKLLPKHCSAERFCRVFLSAVRTNPALLECEPQGLILNFVKACQYGLEVDNGPLGQAYIVPYKKESQLIVGYRGLLALARRSREVAAISAALVMEGDKFEYELGLSPKLVHVPDMTVPRILPTKQVKKHGKNGAYTADVTDFSKVRYVYSVFKLRGEGIDPVITVWSVADVEAHRARYSRAGNSPWDTQWAEMAIKTVLRYPINRGFVPVSIEVQQLVNEEEVHEVRMAESIVSESLGNLSYTAELVEESQPEKEAAAEQPASEATKALPPPDIALSDAIDALIEEIDRGGKWHPDEIKDVLKMYRVKELHLIPDMETLESIRGDLRAM